MDSGEQERTRKLGVIWDMLLCVVGRLLFAVSVNVLIVL